MAYHGVLNTVPCAIRALFICLIYNSLHLLTPNWTDLTLSYSPTTTFKEESLNSLPSVSHHVPKDKGLQRQSPLDLTFCLFLHIQLFTQSPVSSLGRSLLQLSLPSILPAVSLHHILSVSIPVYPLILSKALLYFPLTIPCPFQAYYLITALRIIFGSKNAWPADSENVLYFSVSGPLLTLVFLLLYFCNWWKRVSITVTQKPTYILSLPFINCDLGDVIQLFCTLGSSHINWHGLL